MAVTINKFIGFETGGLEEASSTVGSPDATEATVVRSGDRSLKLGPSLTSTYTAEIFSEVANAGNDHVFGFGVRFANSTIPAANNTFFRVLDSANNVLISFQSVVSSGNLAVRDAAGTVLVNLSAPFTADTWHYIEMYFQNVGSSASWELFIDGVSKGSDTVNDFLDSGTLEDVNFASTSTVTNATYFDDLYWLSGATAATDRLGGASITEMPQVFGYQSGKTSTAPDFDSSGVVGGDSLENGALQWTLTGERPWSDTNPPGYNAAALRNGCVAFNDTNSGGDSPGPSSGSDVVTGTIKASKFIGRFKRSGGGGTDQHLIYGSFDGTGNADVAGSGINDLNLTTSFVNYFFLTESTTITPSATDDFVMGIEKSSGSQDFDIAEMQAMLLHIPATSGTEAVGSSAGTSTALATGESTHAGAGSASGVGTATATGEATKESTGSSTGVATVTGVGESTFEGVGSSAGVAAVTGVGTAGATGTGSSAGVGTATAVGESTHAGVGLSAGVATVTGIGESTAESTGSAAGIGTAAAVGESTNEAAGSSAGVGTASGVGQAGVEAVGSSAGVGAATGVGESTFAGVGSSAGVGTATAVGESTFEGVGNAAGVATVTGVAANQGTGVGNAAGVATVTGVGESTHAGVGSSAGVGTATGIGESTFAGVGSASGVGTASGVGQAGVEAVGSSSGTATATAVGESTFQGVGASAGVATVSGVGDSLSGSVGSAAGIATVTGIGQANVDAVGSAAGTSTATAIGTGQADFAIGSASGTSTAKAIGIRRFTNLKGSSGKGTGRVRRKQGRAVLIGNGGSGSIG